MMQFLGENSRGLYVYYITEEPCAGWQLPATVASGWWVRDRSRAVEMFDADGWGSEHFDGWSREDRGLGLVVWSTAPLFGVGSPKPVVVSDARELLADLDRAERKTRRRLLREGW